MLIRHACSALVATLALSATSMFAHGQVAGPVKIVEGTPDTSAQTPISDVYQSIFALLFFSGPLPRDDAGWEKWPGDDVKKRAVFFFTSIGLDEKAANALFAHVRDGLAQQQMDGQRKAVQLCKGKADITSKVQVADFIAALYDEHDRMQKRLWGSFEFLDARNRELLSAYAMQRREGMQIHAPDVHATLEKSPETLDQVLERICQGK